MIFLNLNNESYYGLDKMGLSIWENLIKSDTIEDAINELKSSFDVDEKLLLKDMETLIDKLTKAGLIEIKEWTEFINYII